MFLEFYGLREQPFGVTPDPEFLYLSATHREALASVAYGIQSGVGFAAVIAKPGMGKTTLLFALLRHFQNSAQSAFLFDTQCNSKELLQSLLAEFKIQEEGGKGDVSALASLRQFLLKSARANQRVLLVVDEAQNLDIPVFETLRLLSNFETPHAKLLHIVLAGQPELGRKLALPELEEIVQNQRAIALWRAHIAARQHQAQPAIGGAVARIAQDFRGLVGKDQPRADRQPEVLVRNLMRPQKGEGAHDAGHGIAVGETYAAMPQLQRLRDQLLGMRSAAQEREIGRRGEFGVAGQGDDHGRLRLL